MHVKRYSHGLDIPQFVFDNKWIGEIERVGEEIVAMYRRLLARTGN